MGPGLIPDCAPGMMYAKLAIQKHMHAGEGQPF
jgi:hypothetical protein